MVGDEGNIQICNIILVNISVGNFCSLYSLGTQGWLEGEGNPPLSPTPFENRLAPTLYGFKVESSED